MPAPDPAIRWLLQSADPAVRFFTLTELCGRSPRAADAARQRRAIPTSPRVRALLRGQRADGGFGVHPYKKWNGAHWRLVSLVELGLPRSDPRARRAAEEVLAWLDSEAHRERIGEVRGRVRQHASQEGNALRVCVHFGLAGDPRVRALARDLVSSQWPDGGWNCDVRPEATHSSFHESLIPLWGLAEYRSETGDRTVGQAVSQATEFFLRHSLFRSERTGRAFIRAQFAYPPYWHYDILAALRVMTRLDKLKDPRVQEALDIVESKRGADGLWKSDIQYWRGPGSRGTHDEVVNWGPAKPNEMVTLNALRVLKAAGRL